MYRKRNINIVKSLKDYIVPIIWLLLIILLIFSVFNGDNSTDIQSQIQNENQIPLEVKVDNDFTEAYIIYAWENKKLIEDKVSLYKWEKIMVKEWNVLIDFLSVWNYVLGGLWELKYGENGELHLESSDLWVNSLSESNINMKYASVIVWDNSHISLSQNEMWSTIYLLSWNVEVRNLVWKSTILTQGQKITISRLNASSEDIDLTILKEDIDDFFKKTDWYIKNNGDLYLNIAPESQNTQTGSKLETYKNANLITFDNLKDESYVSNNSLEISWKYFDDNITKIMLNDASAKINKDAKTFSFNNVDVSSSENDLIFKVFDDSNDLLQKFVYLVYYKWWENNTTGAVFNVKTYSVDGSQFTFTAPTTGSSYTSNLDFITFKWNVLAKWISKVSVNWYTLSSFNWSTWRYHADVSRNNLKDGTNIYDIKYFDANWKLVYNNTFTIIRKPVIEKKEKPEVLEVLELKEEVTYSDEVL